MNTSDNSVEEYLTTDYNNSENNNEESIVNSEDSIEESNNNVEDPYTQLFVDNPDNPFYKCKIDKFEYETDDEESNDFIRTIVIWNFEYNYDFFGVSEIKVFLNKTFEFKESLTKLKDYRNNNNTTSTGILLKSNNECNFVKDDIIHIYLIVYYDNAKCNIEVYGLFNQELEESKLVENIVSESIYGKTGKVISGTNINSTGGDGFVVLHNVIHVE